ncbi:hypothetical protein [Candidatus Methylocalor cossyra]|uniref:Uncharacterized protein n=1 Tax=Candidatus Methylocalor cossyra TaxID=3108543 RepID=A0ABM9NI63_9GAMM
MTNNSQKKCLPGLFALAVFAPLAAAETPGYLSIRDAEVGWESKTKTVEFEIETAAPIPLDGKAGAFGYGALTDGTNNVVVLTTHLPIDDSSHENPQSGFHTHVLDLKQPSEACSGATLEVDLENSAKNSAFDADYAWSVNDRKVEVKHIPVADLGDAGVENLVTFTIKPILDAQQKPTHLCVNVVEKL